MSNQYNPRLRPAKVLIYNGETHLIRRRETFEDLTRTENEFPELSDAQIERELVENM